ncbi:DUF1799 domain-containing protein [Variovorax sp. RT4R15]|uniref:DUF1799 domain-containing protein n=1 Tax=Variovorax sp. RT4R15 TaxID=3443737 RepID=UPI003F459120
MEEACDRAPTEVWPDNWQALIVFTTMSTQWRGSNGPTGFDYGVLPEIWRRTKTPIDTRDEVFDCLQVMELAALEQMRSKPKAQIHG